MCGEQAPFIAASTKDLGSPPRVRGTEPLLPLFRQGKPDHPRVCGEQLPWFFLPLCVWGSPPRVRGTEGCKSYDGNARRITPACAGNRYLYSVILMLITDHPRVCGEQIYRTTTNGGNEGSPPRVRGTEETFVQDSAPFRITPACAGNSGSSSSSTICHGDHPRVCGEQLFVSHI